MTKYIGVVRKEDCGDNPSRRAAGHLKAASATTFPVHLMTSGILGPPLRSGVDARPFLDPFRRSQQRRRSSHLQQCSGQLRGAPAAKWVKTRSEWR
jgi:hypothetical protein